MPVAPWSRRIQLAGRSGAFVGRIVAAEQAAVVTFGNLFREHRVFFPRLVAMLRRGLNSRVPQVPMRRAASYSRKRPGCSARATIRTDAAAEGSGAKDVSRSLPDFQRAGTRVYTPANCGRTPNRIPAAPSCAPAAARVVPTRGHRCPPSEGCFESRNLERCLDVLQCPTPPTRNTRHATTGEG